MAYNAETFLCCFDRFDNREILGKKFLPKPNNQPPPSSKFKWSTPKEKIEGPWTGYHCLGMYEFEYVV